MYILGFYRRFICAKSEQEEMNRDTMMTGGQQDSLTNQKTGSERLELRI